MIHQNRADRGAKNFITMDLLPSNMNLIVWGHEHDCRIEPEEYIDEGKKPRYVTQPGSSVATSLCEGEAIEKKVGILNVCFNRVSKEPVFKIQTIPLKTVRPFIFKIIELKHFDEEIQAFRGSNLREKIEKFLDGEIENLIKESKKLISGHPKQPKLPLIRLRVQFEEAEELLNIKRFGQKYAERVANPGDMLLFKKNIKRLKAAKIELDEKEMSNVYSKKEQADRVEDVVENYFNNVPNDRDKLQMFDAKCLTEFCRLLVNKDDTEGATTLIQKQVDEATSYLNAHVKNIDQVPSVIQQFRDEKSRGIYEDTIANMLVFKRQTSNSSAPNNPANGNDDNFLEDSDDESPKTKAKRGRPRGGATRGAGATRGRGNKANTTTTSTKKPTRGRGARTSIAQQLSMRQSQVSYVIEDSNSD